MSDENLVKFFVDGQELEAPAGSMLIEATDKAGITVPRFCYHKKLSIAANCRMCLVEVEKAPKPLPACATPIMEGMQCWTKSPIAREAQKGTMEFLLINHPLDCPICDQGGECELQDVAMGYGGDVSRFNERKRVIKDKNIGPLIATDMTRCIHCTRCVRFGQEIAGIRELGATGRGEHMEIGTYIEKSVDSEISGNVIDLCPVGALTSKPFRYTARAWELTSGATIAPHDCIGSNLRAHMRRDEVMRVVPRDNEDANETWISDRDRFSYAGLYSDDRLQKPMIRDGANLREATWEEALNKAASELKAAQSSGGNGVAALISPNTTVEEQYLTAQLLGGMGSQDIDCRLRQSDFRAGQVENTYPGLGMNIADLESARNILVIGSQIRKDQPLLAHRIRKAALNGANVSLINPFVIELSFDATQFTDTPAGMIADLAAVASAAGADTGGVSAAEDPENHCGTLADSLKGEGSVILLGALSQSHPDYAVIQTLAANLAEATGATLGIIPEGANSAGAWLTGATGAGRNTAEILEQGARGVLLVDVEPDMDMNNPQAVETLLKSADSVVAVTRYRSAALDKHASVLLPMGGFAETSGTYINANGDWQSFEGLVPPMGEARPGWKILRVMGNYLDLDGFDYVSSADVKSAAQSAASADISNQPQNKITEITGESGDLMRVGHVPIYAIDSLVRRAGPLQATVDGCEAHVRLNADEASRLGVSSAESVTVTQNGVSVDLPLIIDANIAAGCAYIPAGVTGSGELGAQIGPVTVAGV